MTPEEFQQQLDREEIIAEFYYLALNDLDKGYSVFELQNALDLYLEDENYEACAGIKMAIKHFRNGHRINKKSNN